MRILLSIIVADINLCDRYSLVLGGIRPHRSSDWINEERGIALHIVDYAGDKLLISPDEAKNLEKKIIQDNEFLTGDLRGRIEILAQSIDFNSRVKTITDSFNSRSMPKAELRERINKFQNAAQRGDLNITTEALLEIDLQMKGMAQFEDHIHLKKTALAVKQAPTAPPPPQERKIFPPPDLENLPPIPIGMKRPPTDKTKPIEIIDLEVEPAPTPPVEEPLPVAKKTKPSQ